MCVWRLWILSAESSVSSPFPISRGQPWYHSNLCSVITSLSMLLSITSCSLTLTLLPPSYNLWLYCDCIECVWIIQDNLKILNSDRSARSLLPCKSIYLQGARMRTLIFCGGRYSVYHREIDRHQEVPLSLSVSNFSLNFHSEQLLNHIFEILFNMWYLMWSNS